jgi:2-oxo-4-hydroxy-4-carboxy-5-ureidoimidazoline decarboxylase
MNGVLARWNELNLEQAAEEILPCCGSKAWAMGMAQRRPLPDEAMLLTTSDEVWAKLPESDWFEAFRSHPRIGESRAPETVAERAATWSKQEQGRVSAADQEIKIALAEGNRVYEEKFGRTFIVCAAGKSPTEILGTIMRRLRNDEPTELREAAEQQRQITQLRLKKWLEA